MKLRRRDLVLRVLALAAGAAVTIAQAEVSAAEAARIERLLKFVEAQKQAQFIRNGNAYSAKEAAQFLRAKYAKMGEHVTTATQFIEQIAARSSTTGQPYLMRFPDGRTLPSAQVLAEELARIDGRS